MHPIASGLEHEEMLPHVDDDLSYEKDLRDTKFIMKNGCCRECMKAFSKTGKVSHLVLTIDRAAYAKYHAFKEGPPSPRMDANIVHARAAIQLISDATSAKRSKTSLRRKDMANITARDRDC